MGAITYEVRLDTPISGSVTLYAEISLPLADATANLLRHSETENLLSLSIGSAETPTTVAPSAANVAVASAKSCASIVQPLVKAAGKN